MTAAERASAELATSRAWRALFLNDDGTFKPEADVVIRDLEGLCAWMKMDLPMDDAHRVDGMALARDTGKRTVFAAVKKRLFADLTGLKRRTENG